MNRTQIAEVLRAASAVVDEGPIVLGSQAILGTFDEDQLPPAAIMSMEADVAFLHDPDRSKADRVTGAIGEESTFHQRHGYYAEGIHLETATLPQGWRERLIAQPIAASETEPGTVAHFLDRHDLVVAKLAAFRAKDVRFVTELLQAKLVDPETALARLNQTTLHPVAQERAEGILSAFISGGSSGRNSSGAMKGRVDLDATQSRLRRSQRESHGLAPTDVDPDPVGAGDPADVARPKPPV